MLAELHRERIERVRATPPVRTFPCCGVVLHVSEWPGAAIGSHIWGGAEELVNFLASHKNGDIIRGKCVLELGAGTGLVGLAARWDPLLLHISKTSLGRGFEKQAA